MEAARRLTQAMVTQRGWVDDTEIDAFLDAGYTHRHVLDIILGLGMKTLSNYTNHIAHTPLDPGMASPAMEPRLTRTVSIVIGLTLARRTSWRCGALEAHRAVG